MTLTLRINRAPDGVALTGELKTVETTPMSIGRGKVCDWVVEDPNRFLSSRHCEITAFSGAYYVTDFSTNGTFINSSKDPLGRGTQAQLHPGDIIDLGDYQLKVEQIAQNVNEARANPILPESEPLVGDTFAAPSQPVPWSSAADPFAEPIAKPRPLENAQGFDTPESEGWSSSMPGDDQSSALLGDFLSTPSSPVAPAAGHPSSQEWGDPANGNGLQDLLGPDTAGSTGVNAFDAVDPLSAFDKSLPLSPPTAADDFTTSEQDPWTKSIGPSSDQSSGWNIAQEQLLTPKPHAPAPRQTQAPPSASINDAMSWPEAKTNDLIPDDWDDLLSDSPASSPSFHASSHSVQKESNPVFNEPRPAGGALPISKSPQGRDEEGMRVPLAQHDLPSQADMREQAPQTQSQSVEAPKASNNGKLEQLFADTIIRGMGLNPAAMSQERKLEIHDTIGALLPVITGGMMQVLRSRASVKNEFRMNVTTIQPVENNPLKFSANAEEAHENMFVRDSKAYKDAVASFQEGFDSIAEHQLAVIAGIRAAFCNVLQRFDPDVLEQQFASKGLLAKAKLWGQYRDYHKDLVDNMDHTFQYLFGDDFVEAYEDQLRKLEAERRRVGK